MSTLLSGKHAVIYGGGGSIGRASAMAFAAAGATVDVLGRTQNTLDETVAAVADVGGSARATVLDATDETAVDAHAAAVGRIDIVLNVVFRQDVQAVPLIEMTAADYLRGIDVGSRVAFVTGRACARQMVQYGGGVFLYVTSASARGAAPGMGNTGPLEAAVETFYRSLAVENGARGVRTVGVHTAAVEQTLTQAKIGAVAGGSPDVEQIKDLLRPRTMTHRLPQLEEIVATLTFLASDGAGAITSGIVNATGGLVAG